MRSTTLFEAIGDIDDKKIADAVSPLPSQKKNGWMKIASLAACCAVIVGIAAYGFLPQSEKATVDMKTESTQTESTNPVSAKKSSSGKVNLIKEKKKLSVAKLGGDLSFVESIELHEESGKLHVRVTSRESEDIKKLLSYVTEEKLIEIEYID